MVQSNICEIATFVLRPFLYILYAFIEVTFL